MGVEEKESGLGRFRNRPWLRAVLFAAGVCLLALPSWLASRPERQAQILVAGSRLQAGAVLQDRDLVRKWFNVSAVHPFQVMTSDKSRLIGRKIRYTLTRDQPILWSDLEENQMISQSLAQKIPLGSRAVALPLSQLDGYGGLLRPGDTVDLWLLSGRTRPKKLVNSVLLISLDQQMEEVDRGKIPRIATVALPAKEAAWILAVRNRSEIRLLLRNPADVTDVEAGEALTMYMKPRKIVPQRTVEVISGR